MIYVIIIVKRKKNDYGTEISGQSVINIDMSEKLNNAIPVFAGVIVVLAFFLLMIVFRSILVPLKAVLGFILSLMATLGFTTLVIQHGFMGSLFGIENTGPLLAFLPVINWIVIRTCHRLRALLNDTCTRRIQ